MVRGASGRIVIEIDPEKKNLLYTALMEDNLTLKDWFTRNMAYYLENRDQQNLFESQTLPLGTDFKRGKTS